MAGKDKKTEHSGAKKGKGAYWGKKKDAKTDSNKSRRQQDKRESNKKETTDESHELDTNAVLEEALVDEMYPTKEETYPVNIDLSVYHIFQKYHKGQGDPLYSILSRRGDDDLSNWIDASEEEADALFSTAEKLLRPGSDPTEERAGHEFMNHNRRLKTSLGDLQNSPVTNESSVDPLNTGSVLKDAFVEL